MTSARGELSSEQLQTALTGGVDAPRGELMGAPLLVNNPFKCQVLAEILLIKLLACFVFLLLLLSAETD